jgi:hypothetical protein
MEVLTMDDYGAIRRAHRDGKSIRQIAREFQLARKTVRYVLTHSEPRPRPLTRNRVVPVLGAVMVQREMEFPDCGVS